MPPLYRLIKKEEYTMANTKKTADAQTENTAEDIKETVNEKPGKNEKTDAADKTESKTKSSINAINKTIDDVSGKSADEKPVLKNEIGLNERIAVRSATYGELIWISPTTNAHYCWKDIGAVEYIQFDELITMNNSSQSFLTQPYVILMDERAVEYFRLEGLYDKIEVVNNLPDIIKEGDLNKIETVLKDIRSTNIRSMAISKIKELRRSHTLNNIDVMRLIEKILCFDME